MVFSMLEDGLGGGGSSVGSDGIGGISPVLSSNCSAIVWTAIKQRRNRAIFIVVAENFMFLFCVCMFKW